MQDNPLQKEQYKSTIQNLELAKKSSENDSEYWFAREICEIFGYAHWQKFTSVIERAINSISASGINPSHHIIQTDKMMELGKGGRRHTQDYFLSRYACYIIAMNADARKSQISAAQSYFAIQTRKVEVSEKQKEDLKRVELREKVTESFKAVSGAAHGAGVSGRKQAIFHDARYKGLYGMPRKKMLEKKGLSTKENPFDRMGALELSANDFQMNLSAETIKKENVKGEFAAIKKNEEIARRVRNTMIDSGSKPPEELAPAESIKIVKKRIKAESKDKKLPHIP